MGMIGTWQKCPKCEKRFLAKEYFLCHGHKATNFFVQVYWNGKHWQIYHQRDGTSIDSLERAVRTLERISGEVETKRFDPRNYIKRRQGEYSAERYFDHYLSILKNRMESEEISHRYFKQQQYIIRAYLIRHFTDTDIREIRTRHVSELRLSLTKKLSSKTKKEVQDCLGRILRHAREDEIIDSLPVFKPIISQNLSPSGLIEKHRTKL